MGGGGAKGPRPDPFGSARAWGVGRGVGVGWGGAKGPGPDRLGFRPFRPGLGGGEGGGGGWGWGAGGPGPGQKFRSTLAKIAKILEENDIFLINTHYFLGNVFFAEKKPPEGTPQG